MHKLIIFAFVCIAIKSFGQDPPPPPLPPKPPSTGNPSARPPAQAQRLYGQAVEKTFPEFPIPLSESTNPASIYYSKTVEGKIRGLDTLNVSAEQIVSYTKFRCSGKGNLSPSKLDSLANKSYKLNEEKNYADAIRTCKLILSESPNNISGHKEISLAYKRNGQDSLSSLHFNMMVKIINSVFKYGDGTYKYPFIVNNFFEGISIYEAVYRCKPQKMAIMLDKTDRLLGAYNAYSSAYDEIFIRYSLLNHWKPELKEGDYIKEK